jgi:hypothetical protein
MLLEPNADKRISIPGILSHPWMADHKSWLEHCASKGKLKKVKHPIGNINSIVPDILFI